ncbi:MAG: hypothetical protein JWQ09_303 [Segetibacter sp.]|nr:hypothetical protein [Segetibacter sp.]
MDQKMCSKKGCNKEAISFSKFCGKHTSNKDIINKLRTTRFKNLKSLYLDEVEIKKITFSGKIFLSATIQDTDFNQAIFNDCSFKGCGFSNAVFTECKFIDCYFEQWDCKDVTFSETIFERCTFEDWQLNQCLFAEETAITDSTVDSCEITGGFFSETGIFKNVKFLSTNFLQASFAQAKFSECQFIDVDFLKTSLYDSAFTSCCFDTISHDFSITGIPQLCDFRGTRFINMSIPKNLGKWNNLKKEPTLFYQDVVNMLTSLKHPNYLADLAVALSYLQKLNFPFKTELLERVRSHFKYLVNEAYASADYRTLGNIMSEFGKYLSNLEEIPALCCHLRKIIITKRTSNVQS